MATRPITPTAVEWTSLVQLSTSGTSLGLVIVAKAEGA